MRLLRLLSRKGVRGKVVILYCCECLVGGLLLVNGILSYQSKHVDQAFWSTLKYQLIVSPVFLMANLGIGYGVKFGYKAIGNLTCVLSAAKGLEIGISVLMGYIFFKETPSWKTIVGIVVVVVGGFVIAKL